MYGKCLVEIKTYRSYFEKKLIQKSNLFYIYVKEKRKVAYIFEVKGKYVHELSTSHNQD